MSVKTLRKLAGEIKAKGCWAMHARSIAHAIGVSQPSVQVALQRACQEGVVERLARGFYRFKECPLPFNHLEQLASWLRPDDFFYLSLESVLSDAGWISQVPNRLTFMTTGRSYTYHLPTGVVEFVHTKVPHDDWVFDVAYNSERQIRVATPEKALRDLKRSGRNVGLIRGDDGSHYEDDVCAFR